MSGVAFYGDTVCMTASSDDQDGLKVWDLRRLQKVFEASKKGEKRDRLPGKGSPHKRKKGPPSSSEPLSIYLGNKNQDRCYEM